MKRITLTRTNDGYEYDTKYDAQTLAGQRVRAMRPNYPGIVRIQRTRMGDDKQWWSIQAGGAELLCRTLDDARAFLADVGA